MILTGFVVNEEKSHLTSGLFLKGGDLSKPFEYKKLGSSRCWHLFQMVKQQQCISHQASEGLCCTECCTKTEDSSFCNHKASFIKISKADFIGDPLSIVRKKDV